jgi:hypothetical protein
MTTSLAVLFSFNEAVLMVIVFIVLFGLPLFAIFKRMKMEDRRLDAKKKVRRTPPPKSIESRSSAPPPSPTSPPKK